MDEFKEKWNKDLRYRTKIKLSLYTLFVVFVAIFAISNRPPEEVELNNQFNNSINNNQNNINLINIPNEYKYTINININDVEYQYIGTKTIQRENITKKDENTITNYIYENNNYYKEEIYDIINYNYIDLETINTYLSKSEKNENQYLVYLKDIILGNNSNEYITISTIQNEINIDYTKLMHYFNQEINQYLVNIKIENIE